MMNTDNDNNVKKRQARKLSINKTSVSCIKINSLLINNNKAKERKKII